MLFLAAVLAGSPPAAAGGGAGCHSTAITEAEAIRVSVRGFCFEPTVLHVQPGETVAWTNDDPAPHSVTGVNGAWGSFEQFGGGEEVSFRFDTPGTYPYWCVVHPSMLGVVVVDDGSGREERVTVVEGQSSLSDDGWPVAPWALAAFAAGAAVGSIGLRVRRGFAGASARRGG